MPFFFIVPLWLLEVALGAIMICIRATRRPGIYVVTISTLATIVSFALSTAVLFVGPRIAANPPGWFGLVVVLGYAAAIPIGGILGATAGFLLTYNLLARSGEPSLRRS